MISSRWLRLALSGAILAGGLVTEARACAVCYGDPDSALVKGAWWGVALLGAIVYGLLFAIVGITVSWTRRARKLRGS